MTKMVKLSIVAAVLTTGLAASDLKVSGDATFTSNSIWRGTSGTGNTPTIQATLNAEMSNGIYAGMWGTGTSSGSEIDFFAGYATEVSSVSIDAGFVAYTTTNPITEKWTLDDSGELYLGLSKTIANIDLGATVYEEILADTTTTTLEGSIAKDFNVVALSALAGYNTDSETKYVGATLSKSVESLHGDLALSIGKASGSDTVYGISYTTSF